MSNFMYNLSRMALVLLLLGAWGALFLLFVPLLSVSKAGAFAYLFAYLLVSFTSLATWYDQIGRFMAFRSS